jgi:hypothetical protein
MFISKFYVLFLVSRSMSEDVFMQQPIWNFLGNRLVEAYVRTNKYWRVGLKNAVIWVNFFMEATTKDVVFWDMTPCSSSKNQHFGGRYRPHLQGDKSFRLSSSQRMCLKTDGEESLLQRHIHSHVNALPWNYCWWVVVSSNVASLACR